MIHPLITVSGLHKPPTPHPPFSQVTQVAVTKPFAAFDLFMLSNSYTEPPEGGKYGATTKTDGGGEVKEDEEEHVGDRGGEVSEEDSGDDNDEDEEEDD